jgi:two-component system sensor histidine kinase MprB
VERTSSQTPLVVGRSEIGVAAAIESGIRAERDVDLGGESFRQVTSSLGERRGAVQVARSLSELERFVSRTVVGSLVAVLLVAIAASTVAAALARQITRPLVDLTRSAEHVAATGRLEMEWPVGSPRTSDETGRLAAAFQSMLAALALSRGAQQRLVQDAGHELRTPLTSLRANVALLRRGDELSAEDRDAIVADLESETRELTDLVDELVALAGDGAVTDETSSDIDLVEMATEVAHRARRRTGRHIVVLDRAPSGAPVHAPKDGLARAVRNLVDNAAKFDTGDTPLEVSILADEGFVTLEVADRGPGVDAADLDRIFDRFYRTDAARSRPGSGLGLSIVAEVARRCGGTTIARGRVGGGLVVGFRIPAAPADETRPTPG